MTDIVERLREAVSYNSETGQLLWKQRPASHFKDGAHSAISTCKTWNKRFAGKEAGSLSHGYRVITFFGEHIRSHRAIWLLHKGEWPENDIDHIDGNKLNNRIENLRSATNAENHKNQRRRSSNTSGAVGVTWYKSRRKWQARIRVDGRMHSLGYYRKFDDAVAARKVASQKYGFHPNHGKTVAEIAIDTLLSDKTT